MMEKLTQREKIVISKLVDYQRDVIAGRLISLEALDSKAAKELHERHYGAWKEFTKLSDKIDAILGTEKEEQ